MRRFLSRVWIFVLTFAFGLSVSALWRIYTLPALPKAVEVTGPKITEAEVIFLAPEAPEFRAVLHACGPTSSHHVYQSADGEYISVSCENFRSRSAAAQALKRRIGRAEIVERSVMPLGETVVVVREKASELTTNDRSLCETTVSSLAKLRRFQRRH